MESTSHAQGGIGLLARGAGREHEHVIADLDAVGLVAHDRTRSRMYRCSACGASDDDTRQ